MDFSDYKKLYRSIGNVKCPYFGSEEIAFNKSGFTHLLRKGKKVRPLKQRLERLKLLRYCKEILAGNYLQVEYEVRDGKKIKARFWGFKSEINGIKMKVVIRQIGSGCKHFFSIYPE